MSVFTVILLFHSVVQTRLFHKCLLPQINLLTYLLKFAYFLITDLCEQCKRTGLC